MKRCVEKFRKRDPKRTTKTTKKTAKAPISYAHHLSEFRYARTPKNIGFYTTPRLISLRKVEKPSAITQFIGIGTYLPKKAPGIRKNRAPDEDSFGCE